MKAALRLLIIIIPVICAVVLLPVATNVATSVALPQWLSKHRWLSWWGVMIFGAVVVIVAIREHREQTRQRARHEHERKEAERRERERLRRLVRNEIRSAAGPEPTAGPVPDPPSWGDLGDAASVRLETLPEHVRGRDSDLDDLAKDRRRGGLVVLVGPGGTGKSTLAREMVRSAGLDRPGALIWEVSAVTSAGLTAGLITVARTAGAEEPELEAIARGLPSGPDHLWRLLEAQSRRWVLIIDNADDTEILARPALPGAEERRTPRDGTGWVRPTRAGLLLVTSRQRDPRAWPPDARLHPVPPLTDEVAARVLLDHAPTGGDLEQARALARRLGGLPLALYLAGRYLSSEYVGQVAFGAYRRDLDADPLFIDRLRLDPDDPDTSDRLTVMRTWELSLDALAERGLPEARPLLRLLSCYAPVEPVPTDLLIAERLEDFFRTAATGGSRPPARVDQVIRGLDRLGLVDRREIALPSGETEKAVAVHPVIADTNRVYLVRPGDVDPGEDLVRNCAVDILTASLDVLAPDQPPAWPRIRLLSSHLDAVLANSAPRVDDDHLLALIGTSAHVAQSYAQMRSPGDGINLLRPALDEGERRELALDRLSIALQQLAFLWQTVGKHGRAERIFSRLMAAQPPHWPSDDPTNLAFRLSLAVCAAGQQRWAGAADDLGVLLADGRRVLGDEHPMTLAIRGELLGVHLRRGDDTAIAGLRELLVDAERVLGGQAGFTLATWHNLALAMSELGDTQAAEESFRELIRVEREHLDVEHFLTVASREETKTFLGMRFVSTPVLRDELAINLFRKGNAMAGDDRLDEAAATYRELISRFGDDSAPLMRELVLKSLLNLAVLQNQIGGDGRQDDLVKTYQEVEERFRDESDPALRKLTAEALIFQAHARFAGGNLEGAYEVADRAVHRYRELAAEDPASVQANLAAASQVRDRFAVAIAEALLRNGEELAARADHTRAVVSYDALIRRFGDDTRPALRELVALALFHKANSLGDAGAA